MKLQSKKKHDRLSNQLDAMRAVDVRSYSQAAHTLFLKALQPDDDIDRAIRNFPSIFHQVVDAYANAINEQRQAKDDYDVASSKAEGRIWTQAAGTKLTVARAKALVESDISVIKASQHYRNVSAAVTKLDALRSAFEKKSSMLKAEVQLLEINYTVRDHIKPRTRRHDHG